MTEELKNTIAASRQDLSSVARQNDSDILVLDQCLKEMSDNHSDSNASDNDEDDRVGAETQLSEQKAALELYRELFAQLQSMLKEEKIEKEAAGGGGNANVSFGSITSGFGIGISNAPISHVTFGSPSAASSVSKRQP